MKIVLMIAAFLLAGCAMETEQPQAAEKPTEERWQAIAKELPAGKVIKNIFTVSVPRSDLEVGHIDLGEIPVDAGLSSNIYFFPCPCGKMNVVGQLTVVDYEVNDVIDELREARIKIAAVAPMFIGERPKLMMIRFQGEGDGGKLAGAIKKALGWMGEDRNTVK